MPWSGPPTIPASSARLPVMLVHSDAQWDAVCSPVRHAILRTLRARGPSSLAELAVMLDHASDALYHHVARLEEAGLVRQVAPHDKPGRRERVIDVTADRLRLDVDVEADRNSGRLLRMLRAHAQSAQVHLAAALGARRGRLEGPAPDIVLHAETAWLDDDDMARLTAHLDAISHILEAGKSRRRGRLCSVLIAMCPVVRRRGADARPTARASALTTMLESPASPVHSSRARATPKR